MPRCWLNSILSLPSTGHPLRPRTERRSKSPTNLRSEMRAARQPDVFRRCPYDLRSHPVRNALRPAFAHNILCMSSRCRLLGLVAAAFFFGATANAQDSQSLGDVARQQRQQKEQSASAQGKDVAESKVITNEEIPEHPEEDDPGPTVKNGKGEGFGSRSSKGPKQTAEF